MTDGIHYYFGVTYNRYATEGDGLPKNTSVPINDSYGHHFEILCGKEILL